MKIGILSDSHDRLELLERAVEAFHAAGVELVLHAGDFVAPFTAIPLGRLDVALVGVFGNNDGDHLYLTKRFEKIGVIYPGYHIFEIDGLRAVLMHEPKSVDALASSGYYDLIVYGHTHRIDVRTEPCVVINPGESCGYLTGRATIAVLDAATLKPEIIEL